MNDTQLTEQAIEELMREMGASEQARNGPQERKKNPLGRPTLHRRFLNRTVNSVMQHNKREIERTQTSSRQMLREMDYRDRKRAENAFFNGGGSKNDEPSRHYKAKKLKSRSRVQKKHSSHSRSSSSSSNSRSGNRTHKKQKKKHKKRLSKKTKRGKRSSSISSSSTTLDSSSRSRSSSTIRNQCGDNFNVVENGYVNGTLPLDASYMHTNSFALAAMAMAYGHLQGVINSTNSHVATATSTDLLEDDKLSDTSLNASLTKELALTDNDDSDANDEQRNDSGMLTFDLSTSDEDEKVGKDQNKRLISTIRKTADCDSGSSTSCISVDSVNDEDIGNSNAMTESIDDVQVVLSSSESEGETVEIISVQQVKNHQVTVDLTDD